MTRNPATTVRLAVCVLLAAVLGGCVEEDRPGARPGEAPSVGEPARSGADMDAGPSASGSETSTASEAGPREGSEARDPRRTVLFLGNSLTAGFGLPESRAFPALVQERIDSAGLPYRVVAAGLSGETSAGGLRRVGWYLDEPVDVLVLELGANDMLRGQDLAATQRNLQAIIDRVRERSPGVRVVIAGMRAPPNLGTAYVQRYEDLYRELARDNDAALIPFLLQGVAADPALNLDDGIHPNAAGHRVVATNVWAVLEGVLREDLAAG